MKRLLLLFALVLTICSTAMAQDGPANNEIWYTSTDGNIVVPWARTLIHDDYYTSNTYKDGKGVLTFPSEITNVSSMGQHEDYAHKGAFSDCKTLESIIFPSSVSWLGHAVFSGCDNLVYIKFLHSTALWWFGYLENCSANIGKTYILVPEEAVDAYKQAGWPNVYSSSLSGNELQALKEELKKEINEALKPFLPLSDDENAEIETLMTNMKNAADIESALNARYHQFRPVFKEIKYRHTSIYHPVSEPTYTTVGYTQECWEDPETGKLYAEAECTNELNRAIVVTYKKLRKNPIISDNFMYHESAEKGSCIYNWAVEYNWVWEVKRSGTNSTSFEFKVYGEYVANARIKWWQQFARETTAWDVNGNTAIKIFINNNLVHETTSRDINGGNAPKYENWYDFPLPNLQYGNVVRVELNQECSEYYYSHFLASLEYTSSNGGDPDAILIKTDDKRKFKGVDDPELTYNIHYPTSSTERLTDISISRTPGEEPGEYPIHVSYAEPANLDCEILNNDGKLEIVDGVYHTKDEPYSEKGLIYIQDCWEEKATGIYYADGYLEHELKPESVIGYPKLSFSPVTAIDGFSLKESATYDGVPYDWVAETTYEPWISETRTVEFTVTEPIKYNNARLAWYFSDSSRPGTGYRHHKIYKNDVVVDSKDQAANEILPGGVFYVPLSDLKIGDKIKFEFSWEGRNGAPTVAVCLQYVFPQELCLKAQEAGSTVELKRNGRPEPVKIQYSTDYSNWTTVDFSSATTTSTITLANVGDRVYFRKADEGVASGFSNIDYQYSFAMTGKIAASGNVMSLIDNTCEAKTIPNEYCFAMLFNGCESLTSAPRLPAKTLKNDCYWAIFLGCKNLTTAPELPATTLAQACYSSMFSGCTSLATAPMLPAKTLKAYCYLGMFTNCTSLTTAPELPVTTLAERCYAAMFDNCTSLTTAPDLPATTMASGCYSAMFRGCTKLESTPMLPATILASECYANMFSGCTNLESAPTLEAMNMMYKCYSNMFAGCTSLTTAPELPATTLAEGCYGNMFSGCTKLESAPALSATTLAYAYNCYKGMFSGCTNLKSAPELPAEFICSECYSNMFAGCTSLTTAPELPATNMVRGCYQSMFEGCTSLTKAPELPATTLQYNCYDRMFYGCEKLNHIKVGCTSWLHNADPNSASYPTTTDWLNGVASTGTFVCPEALDRTQTGASYIPEGWTPVFEVKANNEPKTDNYYATFYSSKNAYEVPSEVTAYTGVVNATRDALQLTAIKDDIIPAGEPVILKAAQSQVYLLYTTTETGTKSIDNILDGTDEAKTLGANDYALSLGQYGVGFYLWEGKEIGANKAYLTLSSDVKALTFDFGEGTTTSIKNPQPSTLNPQPSLYNLNGVRVDENYKGIVIRNGKKVLQK